MEITALKVKQWLKLWDSVKFGNRENREKPKPEFLIFTIKAGLLKKLSKVYPRRADEKRSIEIGIQRKHDPERSKEIAKYVKYGYPLSDILNGKKSLKGNEDLQMPGWLPTAIVANIISDKSKRGGKEIKKEDLIQINDKGSFVQLILPKGLHNSKWNPDIPPLEIIDGQHRLWSFNPDDKVTNEFELPVVAFVDLDLTWQAYLFYTINIKPKKINRSLAYDLYPLLRIQEWLEKAPDSANIYKETRAQEIVEIMWAYKNSPWKDRINLLGDTKKTMGTGREVPNITQAAFIRNLIASFIKTTVTKSLGGLFGAKLLDDLESPLNWNRMQQASFIIFIWQEMYKAIENCKLDWARQLRKQKQVNLFSLKTGYDDLAFTSKFSLISSDQGVRGFLHIINDIVYTISNNLKIRNIEWTIDDSRIEEDKINYNDIDKTLKDFSRSKLQSCISDICNELVKFDWRTSSEPNLSEEQRVFHMVFKGSSGYKELRKQLLNLLRKSDNKQLKDASTKVLKELGYGN